ncbi:MAG: DNA methyltransferase [Chitinophagaceae bacterium]
MEATKSMGERKNLVFPIPAPDGTEVFPKRQWLWSKDRALEALKKDELEFLKDKEGKWSVHTKQYLKDESGIEREIKAFSIIDNVFSQHGTNEIIELFGDAQIFSFPKPTGLIKQLLNIGIEEENEIILDFFCGSASVAHAALQLNLDDKNRRFIMVQLPEPVEEGSPAFNAGFRTIADISKERIRRVIKKIEIEKAESQPNMFENQEQDLGFKAFCLTQSNFKIWRGSEVNVDNLVQQLEAFTDPVYANSLEQNMLYELMLKAGYLLTDVVREYNILNEGDDEAEHIDTRIYLIADGELIIALNKINQFVVQLIIDESPKKVIMLDNLFTGNDQLKTNTVLQMKDAEIDFKTI